MSQADAAAAEVDASLLPGAPILVRIRSLVVTAVVTASVYATFTHAGKGYCPGGVDADGGFLDAQGQPTDVALPCVQLNLTPNVLLFVAAALVVIGALTRVLRGAEDVDAAIRTLDRAAVIIGVGFIASMVIAQVWFAFIPITDWSPDGGWSVIYPFPFATGEMTVTPAG